MENLEIWFNYVFFIYIYINWWYVKVNYYKSDETWVIPWLDISGQVLKNIGMWNPNSVVVEMCID
jgi:hypothetical protein